MRREDGTGEPRKIGEIIDPALARLDASDRARAYGAWTRAAGDLVVANARPRSFSRGVLTVECESPIWANELTYLGVRILARMVEIDPAQPVERLRFVARHLPSPVPDASQAERSRGRQSVERASARAPRTAVPDPTAHTGERSASEGPEREEVVDRAELRTAVAGAERVDDPRLRRAIMTALDAAAGGPSSAAARGPSVNHKK